MDVQDKAALRTEAPLIILTQFCAIGTQPNRFQFSYSGMKPSTFWLIHRILESSFPCLLYLVHNGVCVCVRVCVCVCTTNTLQLNIIFRSFSFFINFMTLIIQNSSSGTMQNVMIYNFPLTYIHLNPVQRQAV